MVGASSFVKSPTHRDIFTPSSRQALRAVPRLGGPGAICMLISPVSAYGTLREWDDRKDAGNCERPPNRASENAHVCVTCADPFLSLVSELCGLVGRAWNSACMCECKTRGDDRYLAMCTAICTESALRGSVET